MNLTDIWRNLVDPYEKRARTYPALMVMLPLVIPVVCGFFANQKVLLAILSAMVGCGAIYAAGSVARIKGKKVQEKLVKEWGGMPTTIMLRYSNNHLDAETKARYQELAALKLGVSMPTADTEKSDPIGADAIYADVANQLRELTRDTKKYRLLFVENMSYGFHRNMYGVRLLGITTSFLGLAIAAVLSRLFTLSPPYLHFQSLATQTLTSTITFLVSGVLMLGWLFFFDKVSVRRAGDAYAERLLEALTMIPSQAAKARQRKPKG